MTETKECSHTVKYLIQLIECHIDKYASVEPKSLPVHPLLIGIFEKFQVYCVQEYI